VATVNHELSVTTPHTHSNITIFSSCTTTVQCYYGLEVSQSCSYL